MGILEKRIVAFSINSTISQNRIFAENDTIEFEEFVRLMQITLDECEKDEELMNAFRLFDRDGDGFITTEELRLALRDHGDVISLQQTKELLRKADSDGDGRIDYEGGNHHRGKT